MSRYDVSFLLVPKFSMIALYGALEPLRVANRFAGPTFSWRFISEDGSPRFGVKRHPGLGLGQSRRSWPARHGRRVCEL